jgi:phage repressor protein C with HTH and peptisase S24 domain
MLTHAQVWTALDRLAARAGLSASGLAKRAGLDPTTFNKSKRMTPDGRARWPSTESVAKALAATGTSIETFVSLIGDGVRQAGQAMRLISLAQAAGQGFLDDGGLPVGNGWSEVTFSAISDDHAYALTISDDSMRPAYRHGDVVVVVPAAPIRRGDRVVVKTKGGEVLVRELKRKSSKQIELQSLDTDHAVRVVPMSEVLWLARIVLASQ